MTTILIALGAFLIGVGTTVCVARYFFLLGWEKGRDDLVLDPGDETGQLPVVEDDEPTGRHAMRWPSAVDTVRFEAATHG